MWGRKCHELKVRSEGKGRIWEVRLGQRGGSSFGKSRRGMRSYCPTTSQILGPPGTGFCFSRYFILVSIYISIGRIQATSSYCNIGTVHLSQFILMGFPSLSFMVFLPFLSFVTKLSLNSRYVYNLKTRFVFEKYRWNK